MAEEKLIQINLQLPVSELAGVTALVEQLRQLLAAGKRTSTPPGEPEENTGFDEVRFQELEKTAAPADLLTISAQPEMTEAIFTDIPAPVSSQNLTFADMEDPAVQNDLSLGRIQADAVSVSAESDINIPALEAAVESNLRVDTLKNSVDKRLDTAVLDTAVKNDIDAEVLATQVETDIDTNSLRTAVETSIHAKSLQASVEKGINAPSTAGFAVSDNISAFLPERRRDAEQLVTAGPAPLTAEAVSLAFRRDDRRYDNGFPLY